MKTIDYKKIIKENDADNVVVRIVFYGKDKKEYECVGVLIKEVDGVLRVAFNAKDDKIKDFLDIKVSDIVNIKTVIPKEINTIDDAK